MKDPRNYISIFNYAEFDDATSDRIDVAIMQAFSDGQADILPQALVLYRALKVYKSFLPPSRQTEVLAILASCYNLNID